MAVAVEGGVGRELDAGDEVDLEFSGGWLAIEQRAQIAAILDRPGADIDDVIAQFGRG